MARIPDLDTRASGLLLHPTSLPGPHGSGDLDGAEAFLEFLGAAEQRWWQLLPLGPAGYGDSPYSALSAFGGNPLLVGLRELVGHGWLPAEALDDAPGGAADRVDYGATSAFRTRCLRRAFDTFRTSGTAEQRADLDAFRGEASAWLDDLCLFLALKGEHDGVQWTRWAPPLRDRDPVALGEARTRLADEVALHRFVQWRFDRQWARVRAAAEARGIALMGDVPIFVAHDSVDVWVNRELFWLDEQGEPAVVAGVPPDYFSATGQRWGNPLYRWPAHAEQGFDWWIERLRVTLRRVHAVRLDHFIGFHRYWEIPGDEPTAVNGRYQPSPGDELLSAVRDALGELPLVAEDLGAVTPEVHALRARFGLPGLRILQFAFGADPSAPTFQPHHYPRRTVVYTGTHDNDTTVGWWSDRGGPASTRTPAQVTEERAFALAYLDSDGTEIHWDLIRAALRSVANLAVFPVQDVLGLGSEARMNRPGEASGNWAWRVTPDQLSSGIAARLAALSRLYDRHRDAQPPPEAP